MTVIEKAARWVAELGYEAIPAQARLAARYQVLDMVAAVHAAGALEATAGIDRGLGALGVEGGRATVLATGRKTLPTHAAAINAAYSMAQDFDNIIWMGHTCHSAVFAALAVAEHESRDTGAFLTAVVAANEVAGRLGASCFLGPLNGQMTTFIHLAGAAVAAASLLRLSESQTTHALAIALSQPNFALQPAFMKPTSKLLSASTPIQAGIEAAYLAREGITGATDILEDRRGFWSRFSYVPLKQMWSDLGSFWAIETLTMKSFPGCHYFQTACAALQQIRARHPSARPEDFAEIRVQTTKLAIEASRFGAEYGEGEITPVNMNFDIATTLAALLHAGRLTSTEADEEWLSRNSEPIGRIRARISVAHEPRLTAKVLGSAAAIPAGKAGLAALTPRNLVRLRRRYSQDYGSSLMTFPEALRWLVVALKGLPKAEGPVGLCFPSRVEVRFSDGSRDAAEVDLPPGSLASPEAEAALRGKYEHECGRALNLEIEKMPLGEFVLSQSVRGRLMVKRAPP